MKVILVRSRAIDSAVFKLAKCLSDHGYEVLLLVWDRHGALTDTDEYGYAIHSFNLRAPSDTVSAVLFFPIWWLYELVFLLRRESDVIHACDLDTLYPAIAAKVLKQNKLNYIIYDFYANNLPNGPLQPLRDQIRSIVGSIERFGIRFTETLYLVDESRYGEVEGARVRNLVYLYNSPPDHAAMYQRPKPPENGTVTLFYAGVLHKFRGLEGIIKVGGGMEGVRLTIAGNGPEREKIVELCEKVKNVEYIGWLPYSDVLNYSMQSDILFAFYDPLIPNNRFASPNKLFEAMMCTKPIIVSDGSSMAEIVRKEQCGLIIPYNDSKSLQNAILLLKENLQLRENLGANGRSAYERSYGWHIMEGRLIASYEALSGA